MGSSMLGELEHRVLLAVVAQGGAAYSVSIAEHLEALTGLEVSLATIHVSLRRLEAKGLVRSELRHGPVEEGGRERRCYRILEPGRERLRSARRELDALWSAVPAAEAV